MNRSLFSSARDDWETPAELFAELDQEFHFTLDVCATLENRKCERFWSKECDALSFDWIKAAAKWSVSTGSHFVPRFWMNPPYGRVIGKWIAKAASEAQRGALVVALIPARTDTAWWHDYIWDAACYAPRAWVREIRFLRGRVRFVGAPYAAPFPSAIIVFGSAGGNS